MSAATASSTETETIYVRLLNEGVDVWRPVQAQRLSEATFRLEDSPAPAGEEWSFLPGDVVVVEHRQGGEQLVAVARATDIDVRSQSAFALAS